MFLPWTWKMVRRSSPPSLFFSLSVSADPPLFSPLMSTSRLSSCHVFCYHQRDKWETREEESLGARVLTSSPPPPSLHLIFYPPSFCLPEWQLAASRVQWACQPKCRYLPTDLRKYTFWTWLTHACVSYRCSFFFFFFFLSFSGRLVQTCNTHYTPRCPRSFVAIKTCNSTSFTDGLEMDPVGPARRQRPRVKEKKKKKQQHKEEELIGKETISRGLILYSQWFINLKKSFTYTRMFYDEDVCVRWPRKGSLRLFCLQQ